MKHENKQLKASRSHDGKWTFEHIRVGMKNFAGKESMYNKPGNRNFCIFFDSADDLAKELEKDLGRNGDAWNIKWSKPDEDGDSVAYLQCNLNVDTRFPPTIWLIPDSDMSRHTVITKENQSILDTFDWIDIVDNCVDITIRPYDWQYKDQPERHGRKCMVDQLYVIYHMSELEAKYSGRPDTNEPVPF